MKKKIIAVGVFLFASATFAANWETIYQTQPNAQNPDQFSETEIDSASITVRNGIVQAWLRRSFRPSERIEGSASEKRFMSVMALNHFDCQNRESGQSQVLYYDAPFGNGENIDSRHFPREEILKNLRPVAPGTVGELYLEKACALSKVKKSK